MEDDGMSDSKRVKMSDSEEMTVHPLLIELVWLNCSKLLQTKHLELDWLVNKNFIGILSGCGNGVFLL